MRKQYISPKPERTELDEEVAFLKYSLGLDDSDIEVIRAGKESSRNWN